jgi:hypothetical protein
MEGKCKKIIEKLINKYDINLGYNEGMPTNRPADFLNLLNIKDDETIVIYVFEKNTPIFIGFIRLIKGDHNLYISEFVRTSNNSKHRGTMKEVLYGIVCIANSLNLPIEFEAKPSFGKTFGREEPNAEKLYKYYNNIGFKTSRTLSNRRKYKTSPNNLQEIISKLNNNNTTCFGWGCGRTRKRSKQPLPV